MNIIDELISDGHLPADDPRVKTLRDMISALKKSEKALPVAAKATWRRRAPDAAKVLQEMADEHRAIVAAAEQESRS